jgi:hypothetical protein
MPEFSDTNTALGLVTNAYKYTVLLQATKGLLTGDTAGNFTGNTLVFTQA